MPLIQFALSLYFESLLYEKHLLAYTGDIRMNINLIEEKTENKQGSGQVNVNEINIWGNLSVTEEQSFMEKNHSDGNSFGWEVDI